MSISAIKRKTQGFTLIEIVLVLAIAGLLMLVVFLAVSGAQRSRRDHQRKSDLALIVASISTYAANHNGNVPLTQADMNVVQTTYVTNMRDPLSGAPYTLTYRVIGASHADEPPVGEVFYQQGHWCNRGASSNPDNPTDPIAGTHTSPTKFAVWTALEGGGQNGGSAFCLDNNQ